jgi:hypothetical protein
MRRQLTPNLHVRLRRTPRFALGSYEPNGDRASWCASKIYFILGHPRPTFIDSQLIEHALLTLVFMTTEAMSARGDATITIGQGSSVETG